MARKALQGSQWQQSIIRSLYRPFDVRSLLYHGAVLERPRNEVMRHMLAGKNLALATTRSIEIGRGWEHVLCTKDLLQLHTVSLKEVNYLFPLYLYEGGLWSDHSPTSTSIKRSANLSTSFIEDAKARLDMTWVEDGKGDRQQTFGPEDVFSYLYAVFHSPTYRERYAEFLKIDFPRLPLTSNADLFRALCALGDELVRLHLLEGQIPAMTSYPVKGDDLVDTVQYTPPVPEKEPGRVWINKTQCFVGVPPEVWEFHVGGYQVCQKWLKDRKGRPLTHAEKEHYQKIITALAETIRLMAAIDEAIEEHGGWPIG
jgi:predicted helicase